MKQTLRINNLPIGLNEYRNTHYHTLNTMKSEWETIVKYASREQKLQPMEKAVVTLEYFFKDKKRRDADNCLFKFIGDGLVKAGILPDDNFNHVVELRIKQGGISKHPYVLVHLEVVS